MTDDTIHPPTDSPRPVADLSRARRRHAVGVIRRSGVLRDTTPGTALVYAVGCLIADDSGYIAETLLQSALRDPSIVQAARELLRKAAA